MSPTTSTISSPVTKRARSIAWAFRSPCAPEPAISLTSPPAHRGLRDRRANLAGRCRATDGPRRSPPEATMLPSQRRRRAPGGSRSSPCDARPPRARRRASRLASTSVFASGFSQKTCLPAFAAAIAIGAWVSPGVQTSTRSMSSAAGELLPLVRAALPTEPLGERLDLGLDRGRRPPVMTGVTACEVEELGDLEVGVRVRLAHEAVADESDAERICHGLAIRAAVVRVAVGAIKGWASPNSLSEAVGPAGRCFGSRIVPAPGSCHSSPCARRVTALRMAPSRRGLAGR